jgi:hypothetical protein
VILEEEGSKKGVRSFPYPSRAALAKHDAAMAFVPEEDREKKSM